MVLSPARIGETAGVAVMTYLGAPVLVGGPYLDGGPVPDSTLVVVQLLTVAFTCARRGENAMVLSSARQALTARVVVMLTLTMAPEFLLVVQIVMVVQFPMLPQLCCSD